MLDYGFATFTDKQDLLRRAQQFWNPDKTQFWIDAGVDLVIDRREGYRLWDIDGHELIDVHLNGGTYNLGHRNPELVDALKAALDHFDIGNHHFPSIARTALAEALLTASNAENPDAAEPFTKVAYGAAGGEVIDLAIKSARHATQRRKIVSIRKGYHGHTGLAVAAGDERFAATFLSDRPDEFIQVPFNDLAAMAAALERGDVAAVLMETIPATYGFPLPAPGYLAAVRRLCAQHGSLYIADEVQTGLMRTGRLWGIQKAGIAPDMIVSGKGITGGLYPISALILNAKSAGWLEQDGFAHMSTAAGAELGCIVALKALEITLRPEVKAHVGTLTDTFAQGLAAIRASHPEWFVGVRQEGVVMGLEFDHPSGAKFVMEELYRRGVWAIFSTLDPRVLQFKPGLLVGAELAATILERLDDAIGAAAARATAASSVGHAPAGAAA